MFQSVTCVLNMVPNVTQIDSNLLFLFDRHTSGSTGMPKPLIWTQESAARQHLCSSQEYSKFSGTSIESMLWGKRVMVTVPPFHVRISHETPEKTGMV